ncbi:MAG: hypothetical protein PHU32_05425 [Candidatus ainarchaeum sp.]|nr:hypothetical protein [Candidatus ainarchaeum sp.]
MNKKQIIFGAILLVALIVASIFVFNLSSDSSKDLSYDDLIEEEISKDVITDEEIEDLYIDIGEIYE